MVSKIPKLENIASMIGRQYSESGPSEPAEIEIGAKLLRMLIEYDIVLGNRTTAEAISMLRENADAYHVQALELFATMVLGKHTIKSLDLDSLLDGMILEANVTTTSGEVLLSHGHELTGSMIKRLRNFSRNGITIVQPIVVRVQAVTN